MTAPCRVCLLVIVSSLLSFCSLSSSSGISTRSWMLIPLSEASVSELRVDLLRSMIDSTAQLCSLNCSFVSQCHVVAFSPRSLTCLHYGFVADAPAGKLQSLFGSYQIYRKVPKQVGLEHRAASVAVHQPCQQISDYGGSVCDRAVDGNASPVWRSLSCTHTALERDPWWRVDLGQPYYISHLVIVNRADERERLQDFSVFIQENNNGSLPQTCASRVPFLAPVSRVVPCGRFIRGQVVTIQLMEQRQYLTLCEVSVYGFQ